MKNPLLFLLLFLFGATVSAQRVHFIYFETDNSQPFYLKMDDKVYTSTATGSFVLTNLADSTYQLSIGFPSSSNEAKFKLPVNGKDYGYAIKSFDFGLGLFDMQSLAITKPQADNWKSNVTYQYRNNDFTTLLAKASNDTSLYYVPVFAKQELIQQIPEIKTEKPETVEPIKADTSTSVVVTTANTNKVSEEKLVTDDKATVPVLIAGVAKMDTVIGAPWQNTTDTLIQSKLTLVDTTVKTPEVSSGSLATVNPVVVGGGMVATSGTNNGNATVLPIKDSVMVVPVDTLSRKTELPQEYRKSTVKRLSESSTSEGFGLVFYDILENGIDTIQLIIPNSKVDFKEGDTTQFENGLLEIKKDTQVVPPLEATKTPKSKCTSAASDNDFFKLRKNMAAKESDEEMIGEAKKVFKSKCFSTGQIKNLSSLFLNDEGKYQFFDAAYAHVTDQEVFYALQSELKEEYYLKRFKALIGE